MKICWNLMKNVFKKNRQFKEAIFSFLMVYIYALNNRGGFQLTFFISHIDHHPLPVWVKLPGKERTDLPSLRPHFSHHVVVPVLHQVWHLSGGLTPGRSSPTPGHCGPHWRLEDIQSMVRTTVSQFRVGHDGLRVKWSSPSPSMVALSSGSRCDGRALSSCQQAF